MPATTQTCIIPSTHVFTALHVHTNHTNAILHQPPASRTTSAQPQTHHATATRYTHTHKHHALEARQSRVPPHSRRDVLCPTFADGVPPKTMCASPCPPPHKQASHRQHMRSPPPTCTPTQHFTTHAPLAQPQTHHTTATRYPHLHHALKARQNRVSPHSRRDVPCSPGADGVGIKTMCASPCPPPHTNMHHTVNTCVHRLSHAHQHNTSPPTRLPHNLKHTTPQPRGTHTNTTHLRIVRVAFRSTAVAMCCAPPEPMEFHLRLCVRHHGRHQTQTCITPSTHAYTASLPSVHTNTTLNQPPGSKHTTPRPRGTH